MAVGLPLTGTGGTTADVATELLNSVHYQYVKITDGVTGSSVPASVKATTPGSTDGAMVTRPIGSTAFTQAVVVGSGGSTANTVGAVALTSGTQTIGTVLNATSTSQIGSIALVAGSSANTVGSVALVAGSSSNIVGAVVNAAGSSAVTIGAVALSSANPVYLGLGTSATYNFMQSIPFSSGNVSRTSVATSADIQIIAANASRKALIIGSRSTLQTVGIGFSTAAVTTALANVDFFLEPSKHLSFGLQGGLPLYLGPLRAINLTSTAVTGSVSVTEFT